MSRDNWSYELNTDLVPMVCRVLPGPVGFKAMGLYVLTADYLAGRARVQQRRDVDFTLEEILEYAGGQIGAEERQALVTLELWADLGDGRFRLLGLNRWVRIRGLKVRSAATGHRVPRALE